MKNLFDLNSFSGKIIDDESDLIPLMTSDDEEAINKEKLPKSLSILPLKILYYFQVSLSQLPQQEINLSS